MENDRIQDRGMENRRAGERADARDDVRGHRARMSDAGFGAVYLPILCPPPPRPPAEPGT